MCVLLKLCASFCQRVGWPQSLTTPWWAGQGARGGLGLTQLPRPSLGSVAKAKHLVCRHDLNAMELNLKDVRATHFVAAKGSLLSGTFCVRAAHVTPRSPHNRWPMAPGVQPQSPRNLESGTLRASRDRSVRVLSRPLKRCLPDPTRAHVRTGISAMAARETSRSTVRPSRTRKRQRNGDSRCRHSRATRGSPRSLSCRRRPAQPSPTL